MKIHSLFSFAKMGRRAPVALVFAAALTLTTGAAAAAATPPTPAPTSKVEQAAMTPAQALEKLVTGNARFAAGQPLPRDAAAAREQTAAGQFPFAVVLSCIDSRASSEVIFDQGLGDVFNARLAGNVLNADVLGSMEFACKLAGAKLIAVVGHSHCGAVKGACGGAQLGHLTGLLDRIQPAVAEARKQLPAAAPADAAFVETVAELNVRLVLRQIREQSPVLRELIDAGIVGLVGGIHDLDSGKVRFLSN